MRVLNDLVLILPKPEEKSALVRPESSKEFPQEGTVVAVGDNTDVAGGHLRPGNNVVYRKWAGDIVSIDGIDHIVVKLDDVLLVLKEK